MTVYYEDDAVTLHHGDCIEVIHSLPDASVDAVVTDPPYGLEFMGAEWDAPWKSSSVGRGAHVRSERGSELTPRGEGHSTSKGPYLASGVDSVRVAGAPFQQWCEQWASECLRVLKPGGHMLAFGGTRTWHRLACAIEDAGFEVRDSIAWLYGSGFPKSLDVSKAIDKAAGAEREVVGINPRAAQQTAKFDATSYGAFAGTSSDLTAPATPDAARWEGWGTALKPAFEPIVVARKPLIGTVAGNVLEHGTGALNIDGCRVGDGGQLSWAEPRGIGYMGGGSNAGAVAATENAKGRWPANVVLDESQAEALDEQSGTQRDGVTVKRNGRTEAAEGWGNIGKYAVGTPDVTYGGQGGASRFFYVAKADATERPRVNGTAHPTVKPLDLMRWLVRLVTPPGGTVLEPFAGSGTTVEACIVEGFRCIAIEKGDEYLPLIESRITRRRDPVRHVELTGADPGLFDFLGGEAS